LLDSPKKYLQQIRLYDSHINTKLKDLHQLKEMVTKITQTLKDDVVSGGGNQDKLGDAIAKIVDLKAEIDRDIDHYVAAKQEISATLDKLTDPDQLQVLHMRYVQNKTWEQIACDMHMTYRNVCYIHGKGLQSVNQILKGM
jgi:DNA-directed RNA polymerase specialized sigma subunit